VLVRASDSEVGSSDAQLAVDTAARTVSGSVTSGNFCGYLGTADRRSYYTLHFVAVFDQPFAAVGAWEDAALKPGATRARGGTGYGTAGTPPPDKGSGAYLVFDTSRGSTVGLRVGISYVSLANAQANLRAEAGPAVTFDASRARARQAWNQELGRIQLEGGTPEQLTVFYTALYHSLLHPNLFSDSNGDYAGFDGRTHQVAAPQRAQYANFSGWDVYRSQLQLVTWLDPDRGSDIAQSLLNQADQNQGVWDRWTHNAGATAVMTGDPAAIAVASIHAFGGTRFDVRAALASLVKAATTPTPLDLSKEGCPVACRGQRPSLDRWLSIHYIPAVSNSWGGAGETLEAASADFAVSQLALRLGEEATHQRFLARAQYWQNVFNPKAGYIQNRNADGSWPPFDPADDEGFAEGSSAQYSWMVPFNVRGLIDLMGGNQKVNDRLDAFFHHPDGGWAITGSGGLYAELDNEPSIGAPWVYLYTGRPGEAQRVVRQAVNTLWSDSPHGIPGNDDLGAMSSWYVFATLGLYPAFPGRAELLVGSPLFRSARLQRASGRVVTIRAPRAAAKVPYVHGLRVNGRPSNRSWLPESFIAEGGELDFQMAATPSRTWATSATDAPPSFGSDER
jgi:predicted alpha-1,2-mannosidase